ncbi:hypothetical protein Tco_0106874, partial [Tanacetum coccineum]
PVDKGDDDDDESSDDDEDDDDVEEDEDQEEEHLALADSVPSPAYRTTSRMSIRPQTPVPFPSEAEVDRILAISTMPPSLLTSYSSPLPQIPSPPLPVLQSYDDPVESRVIIYFLSTTTTITYCTPTNQSIYGHDESCRTIHLHLSTSLPSETPPSGTPPLLPIPLPTLSQPLLLPSTDCRAGVSEVTLPPQKRLCITLGLRFEVRKSLSAPTARPTGYFRRDYGFVTILDDEIRQDTDEIYRRLDDAKDDRSLMSG